MKLRPFIISFYLLLFPFSFLIFNLFLSSCEATDPGDPPKTIPTGYQEDIPWPSLAVTPCSILNGSPQRTNRLNGELPTSYGLNWVIDTLNISSGIVADNNNNIYFPSPPYLYSFNTDGKVNWKLKLGVYSNKTPIITSANELMVYFQSPSKIYSVSLDGNVNWELPLNFNIVSQLNIGKTGEIYFITDNRFYGVSNGVARIIANDIRMGNLFSLSPDGEHAYIVSRNASILSLNLISGNVDWEVGKGLNTFPPHVDAYGNIYFSSLMEGYNNDKPALFCVNQNAEVIWFYSPHDHYGIYGNTISFSSTAGALDVYGNYYFGTDTIYSVSCKGELNWKYIPDSPIGSDIICDDNQNILLMKDYGTSFGLVILSSEGNELLNLHSGMLIGNSTKYHGICIENKLIIPTQDRYLYSFGGR